MLLQLRDDRPDIPWPNCWGTFGGQIEENEGPEDALKREIWEELQYDIVTPEYFGNFPFDGYDIHMYRVVDPDIKIEDLTVREGQRGQFFTCEEIGDSPCAANCHEIMMAYFALYHKEKRPFKEA